MLKFGILVEHGTLIKGKIKKKETPPKDLKYIRSEIDNISIFSDLIKIQPYNAKTVIESCTLIKGEQP